MSTRDRLVTEAALLMDTGGDEAVTLRAVAHAVCVSHNTPYRHFKDRNALLAAIAERDLAMLTNVFDAARTNDGPPIGRLERALTAFFEYGRDYPCRYRLLFSNPAIGAPGSMLEAAAFETFLSFARLVEDCQTVGVLPAGPTRNLAGLIYATAHGLVDLQAGGRMREQKGLTTVEQTMALLLNLLRTTSG